MPEQPYHYFNNSFLVVTRDNYKLMFLIGEDHFAKLTGLQADPDVAAIKLTYDPVWLAYKGSDQNLNFALGNYKGKTQTVEEKFAELNTKLKVWEGKIHNVYAEDTPEEVAFFPQKRKLFQQGTYESRISAIKVLGDKCALDADATIVALSAQILAFHTAIEGARLLQQSQGEGVTANLRTLRETARVLLCRELYGNMGLFMHKHRANPTDVAQYFEMQYLRSHAENKDVLTVGANQVENIDDNIQPGDVDNAKVKNNSDEDVTFGVYYANSPTEPPQPGYAVVQVPRGVQITLGEVALGPPKQFLNTINLDPNHIGKMEITGDMVSGSRGIAN